MQISGGTGGADAGPDRGGRSRRRHPPVQAPGVPGLRPGVFHAAVPPAAPEKAEEHGRGDGASQQDPAR